MKKETIAGYKSINKATISAMEQLVKDIESPFKVTKTKEQVINLYKESLVNALGEDAEDRYIAVEALIQDGSDIGLGIEELKDGVVLNISVQVDAFQTFFLLCVGKGSGIKNGIRWQIEYTNELSTNLEEWVNDIREGKLFTEEELVEHFKYSLYFYVKGYMDSNLNIHINRTKLGEVEEDTKCITISALSNYYDGMHKDIDDKYTFIKNFTFFYTEPTAKKQGKLTTVSSKKMWYGFANFVEGKEMDAKEVKAFNTAVTTTKKAINSSKAKKNSTGGFTEEDLNKVDEILGDLYSQYDTKQKNELARMINLGYDITKLDLTKPKQLKAQILLELRNAISAGVDIKKVWRKGYHPRVFQLHELWLAQKEGIDLGEYADLKNPKASSASDIASERLWRKFDIGKDSKEVQNIRQTLSKISPFCDTMYRTFIYSLRGDYEEAIRVAEELDKFLPNANKYNSGTTWEERDKYKHFRPDYKVKKEIAFYYILWKTVKEDFDLKDFEDFISKLRDIYDKYDKDARLLEERYDKREIDYKTYRDEEEKVLANIPPENIKLFTETLGVPLKEAMENARKMFIDPTEAWKEGNKWQSYEEKYLNKKYNSMYAQWGY